MKVVTEYNIDDIIKIIDDVAKAQDVADSIESYHISIPFRTVSSIIDVLSYIACNWNDFELDGKSRKENEEEIYSKSLGYIDHRLILDTELWKKLYFCLKDYDGNVKPRLSINDYVKCIIDNLSGTGFTRLTEVLTEKFCNEYQDSVSTVNSVLNLAADVISNSTIEDDNCSEDKKVLKHNIAVKKNEDSETSLSQEINEFKSVFDRVVWNRPENDCEACYGCTNGCTYQCSIERRPFCFKRYKMLCNTLCDFCKYQEECEEECKNETKPEILPEK